MQPKLGTDMGNPAYNVCQWFLDNNLISWAQSYPCLAPCSVVALKQAIQYPVGAEQQRSLQDKGTNVPL